MTQTWQHFDRNPWDFWISTTCRWDLGILGDSNRLWFLGKKSIKSPEAFWNVKFNELRPNVWNNIQILHAKGCHSREISENIRKLVTRFKILRETPENYMQLIHKNIQTYPNPTLLLRYRSISPVVSQPGRVGPRYWSVPELFELVATSKNGERHRYFFVSKCWNKPWINHGKMMMDLH